MDSVEKNKVLTDYLYGLAASLLALSVYLLTFCPSIYIGDSGELTTAACIMGIGHPPGYPLYCVIGHAFSFIPVGRFAFRLCVFCALCNACTVFLLRRILQTAFKDWSGNSTTVDRLLSSAAALLFAFSVTNWSSGDYKIYPLNTLLVAVQVYILQLWTGHYTRRLEGIKSPYHTSYLLVLLAFIYGLSLTNHQSMSLFGPVFLSYIIWVTGWKGFKKLFPYMATTLFLFGVGLLVYAYLPLRSAADPLQNWGEPNTIRRAMNHILRKQYGGQLTSAPYATGLFLQQIWLYLKSLHNQYPFYLLWLAVLGGSAFIKRNIKSGWLMVALFFINSVCLILVLNFEITPRTLDLMETFYLPSYFFACLLIGLGAKELVKLSSVKSRQVGSIVLVVFLLTPFVFLKMNYVRADKSRYYLANDSSLHILDVLQDGDYLFLAGDNEVFTLAYLQFVEKRRTGVKIYSENANTFKNIFAPDLWVLAKPYQNIIVTKKEREIIEANPGRVYCYPWTAMHNFREYLFQSRGLCLQVFKPGMTPLPPVWPKRVIRNVDDNVYKNYLSRDNLVHYYFSLAEYNFLTGNFEEGFRNYERASKAGYDIDWAHNNLGASYLNRGKIDMAIAEYKKSIAVNPNFSNARFNLGAAYVTTGQPNLADAEFAKCLETADDKLFIRYNMGLAYSAARLWAKAAEHFAAVVAYEPAYMDARQRLAVAYRFAGSADADKLLEQLKTQPNSFELHYQLGHVYLKQYQVEEAIAEFKKVIQLNPELSEGYNSMAMVLIHKGQNDEAIPFCRKAIALNPASADAYNNLGVAYGNKGDTRQAIEYWRKAIEVNPDHNLAKENLKKVGAK